MSRLRRLMLLALVDAVFLTAQSKSPVPISEWGKWESIGFEPAPLAPNGQWLAYIVTRSNGNRELRVAALGQGKNQVAAFGEGPAFSADSQWLGYLIGIHEDQEVKLKKDKKPVRKKFGLMRLATGETTTFDDIESFAFSKTGAFLAMRHYAPEKPGAPAAAENAPPPDPQGATLVVRDLSSGADSSFGSVTAFAWEDKGPLLAMTIGAEGKAGNAVQVYDPSAGLLRSLDSAAANYFGLAWRKDARDLAVLRTRTDKDYEEETCALLAFRNAAEKLVYDPTADSDFPAGKRIGKSRAPAWSEDGSTLFVGLGDWEKKQPPLTKKEGDETATVDVGTLATSTSLPSRSSARRGTGSATRWPPGKSARHGWSRWGAIPRRLSVRSRTSLSRSTASHMKRRRNSAALPGTSTA